MNEHTERERQELVDSLLPILLDAQNFCWPDSPRELTREEENDEEQYCMEFRLQTPDGTSWQVHTGDPSYEQDHSGYWGSGSISADDEACNVADQIDEAIEQALDGAIESGGEQA